MFGVNSIRSQPLWDLPETSIDVARALRLAGERLQGIAVAVVACDMRCPVATPGAHGDDGGDPSVAERRCQGFRRV